MVSGVLIRMNSYIGTIIWYACVNLCYFLFLYRLDNNDIRCSASLVPPTRPYEGKRSNVYKDRMEGQSTLK